MRVRDRESLRLPKEASRRRHERFTEDRRRYRQRAEERLAIVKGLGGSPRFACVEALMVPGNLAVTVKPAAKTLNGSGSFLEEVFLRLKKRMVVWN
jgi:hypothetical protein